MLLSLLVAFCLTALLFEAGAGGLGMRAVSVLGVLVATNSVLRFAEAALPGPGGFSPVFFLIILTGYSYGARMGFLMGSLTMALSGLVTGGVGPWLPYQMLVAGWVGLTAGWLPRIGGTGIERPRRESAMLAVFGAAWGILYGVAMTLWFWPFLEAGSQAGSAAGTGSPAATWQRFLAFYVATSLVWDLFRSAGNVVLILVAGGPVLVALRRFGLRFRFAVTDAGLDFPSPSTAAGDMTGPLSSTSPACEPTGSDPDSGPSTAGRELRAAPGGPASGAGLCDFGPPSHDRAPIEHRNAGALSEGVSSEGRQHAPPPLPDSLVHARAWLSWLLAITALASLTRHPFVLLAAALAVLTVRAVLPVGPARGALPVGRLALVVVPVAALYSFLTIHSGANVIARLPATWPLVGGPLTLESLVHGLVTGGALVVLLVGFAVLRQALSARSLVRLMPRGFGELTLVGAVALTYVPAVTRQAAATREAQAIRGHEVRGVRDLVPLAVPVLIGGLEHAIQLSESIASRGMIVAATPGVGTRVSLLASVLLVGVGWFGWALGQVPTPAASVISVVGIAVAVAAVLAAGRTTRFTAFHQQRWRATDGLVAVAPWAPLILALASQSVRTTLAYTPYPALSPPPLDPWLALALLGIAAPAAVLIGPSAGRGGSAGSAPQHGASR